MASCLWNAASETNQQGRGPGALCLEALRENCGRLQRDIATPGKVDEPVTWWTGETIPFRGAVWGAIRHRCYHLGELVYLRQVLGVNEPKYYHEE